MNALAVLSICYWENSFIDWNNGNLKEHACRLLASEFGVSIYTDSLCQQMTELKKRLNWNKNDDSLRNDVSHVMVTVTRAIWIWKPEKKTTEPLPSQQN